MMTEQPPFTGRSQLCFAVLLITACLGGGRGEAQELPLPPERGLVRGVDHPEERAFEIVVGPVRLPAKLEHLRLPVQIVELPLEGWIHGFSWKLEEAGGRPLPDELLHHVNLIDPDRRELFAPIARRVMAAGRETKAQAMPRLIGYPVQPGTRLLVASMFANPLPREVAAYLRVRLVYSRKGEGLIEPRAVYPFYLDVMGPVGQKDFPVPPGRTVRSWEFSPALDAWILGVGGHLHDYGVELRLEDATEGKVIWRAEPQTEGGTHVVSVPSSELWWQGGLKIQRSHRYRVVAVYDNTSGRMAPAGGMGAVGGVVLAGADWPAVDRKDPAYVADLQGTMEAPHRQHGHGAHGPHR